MKQLIRHSSHLILVLMMLGCKVQFVPEYNAEIAKQIDATSKMVDKMYLEMLETTTPEQRDFSKFAKAYVSVEVELNSLLNKNKIRPLNEHSIKITELTLAKWIKYKEEHKRDFENDGKYASGNIKINRIYIRDFFNAMIVAENATKIIKQEQNQ